MPAPAASSAGSSPRSAPRSIEPTSTAAYLLGLAIIIGAIFALGVVVESGLRSFVLNSLDWLMRRIPIISNIYDCRSPSSPSSIAATRAISKA